MTDVISYPMSLEQESIWLSDQLGDGPSRYLEYWAHRLTGPIDADAIDAALTAIVARHETLRSPLLLCDGEPSQVVHPAAPVHARRVPVTTATVAAALREALTRPVPSDTAPLLRATLLHGSAESILVVAIHHAVVDGWSIGLLNTEFSELYAAATERRAPRLAPLRTQFGPYAAEQRRRYRAAATDPDLRYWTTALHGAPPESTVPATHQGHSELRGRGGRVEFAITGDTSAALRRLARAGRTTPLVVVAAALAAVVGRLAGQDDVVIGTPVARRDDHDAEAMIACRTDLLPLRFAPAGDKSVTALLSEARSTLWEAVAHRDIPFAHLVRNLRIPSPDRFPIFQVVVAVDDTVPGLRISGVTTEPLYPHDGTAKYDLFLRLIPQRGGYRTLLEYARDRYLHSDAENVAQSLRAWLDEAGSDPECRLADLGRGALAGNTTASGADGTQQDETLRAWSGDNELAVPGEVRHDPSLLLDLIEDSAVTRLLLPAATLQLLAEAACADVRRCDDLQEIVSSDESLLITAPIRRFFTVLTNATLSCRTRSTDGQTQAWQLAGHPSQWPSRLVQAS